MPPNLQSRVGRGDERHKSGMSAEMTDVLAELIDLLTPRLIGAEQYLGESQDLGWGSIFGGQVLGQAQSCSFSVYE